MYGLIQGNSFCTLITVNNGEINANHLPLILHSDHSEKGTLRGHISKGNPLWKSIKPSENVLVIFQGADHYISPNWYPSKHEHHKEVPTWNYAVVHAYGKMNIIEDTDLIKKHLNELTNLHEKDHEIPWKVTDAPEKYISQQIKGIVGIEIIITRLEGKWKASQNKKEQEKQGVIKALDQISSTPAQIMAKMIAKLSE